MHAGGLRLVYVHRPVLLDACLSDVTEAHECLALGTGQALQLPDYGVELVIKNMEYSALDDRKVPILK